MPSGDQADAARVSYRDKKSFGALDGFRAFAILAVVWHHTDGRIPGVAASARGFLGVDLFFVISGFLIVSLLLRERDARGAISLSQFYVRRTLRIFPVYYGLLALVSVALLVKPNSKMAAPFFEDLPFYLTYTSNWVRTHTLFEITWSLSAEEQFYLLWPPIERYLPRLWLPLLLGVVGVSQLVNSGLLDPTLHDVLGVARSELSILQSTFTPIALGVLLAHLFHDERGFRAAWRIFGHRAAPLVALAALGVFVSVPRDLAGWPRLGVHLSMALLVGSTVIKEDHVLRPVTSFRPLARVGMVSYGMYLFHMLVLGVVKLDSPWLRFAIAAPLTWAVAELSYRHYEKRFLELKKRFAPDRDPAAPATFPLSSRDRSTPS